ncbi:MAG: uroporphyrinogen decarboxylase [Caulobacterales bacterium]|nr:uroporphyrinogen decarboxylase [Caulobacterales bacterium]
MTSSPLLRVLHGERVDPPPVWLMRQAGRYLPEYRDLRARSGDFISFCLDPELAAEATLQPLRRYTLDAAIVFADILLLPHVIGQRVRFEAGHGPVLTPLQSMEDVGELDWSAAAKGLAPVCETLRRVRAELYEDIAVIGFAGAPWTVATYMIAGGKDPLRWDARATAWRDPALMDELLGRLAEATADYLIAQARAGAGVLKIFDSWTDALPPSLFERVSIAPTAEIVRRVRAAGVDAPIIGFPRGCGPLAADYAERTGVSALALDMNQASPQMLGLLPPDLPVQGGFDPALLAVGGAVMAGEAARLRALFADRPYIFNLGHGIAPSTRPGSVEELLELVRE